jgi:hypothetical protein
MASLAAAAKSAAEKGRAKVSSINRDTGNHQPKPDLSSITRATTGAGEGAGRPFSTPSSPPGAAAGRPRPGDDTTVTGEPASPYPGWCGTLTARTNVANIGAVRGVIRRLDEWGEARPWLTAACAGLVLAAILTSIGFVFFDSPDWLFLLLLTVPTTLAWGFKGQLQRRRSR